MSAADDLRDAGMASVYANAPLLWKIQVVTFIAYFKKQSWWVGCRLDAQEFKECFRAAGGMEPHHQNAWGPFWRAMKAIDWLEETGQWRKGKTPAGHSRRIPIYRGK